MKPRWQFDVIASESWLCFAEDATYEVQRPLFCLKASGHHVAHGQGACNPGENVPNPSFNSFSPRGLQWLQHVRAEVAISATHRPINSNHDAGNDPTGC